MFIKDAINRNTETTKGGAMDASDIKNSTNNFRVSEYSASGESDVYIDFVSKKCINPPKEQLLRATGASSASGKKCVGFSHSDSANGLGDILVDESMIRPMRMQPKNLKWPMSEVCLGKPGTRYKVNICTKLPENGNVGKYAVVEMTAEQIRNMKSECYEAFRAGMFLRRQNPAPATVSDVIDIEELIDYADL